MNQTTERSTIKRNVNYSINWLKMQLAEHTILFRIGRIPAIGNFETGGLIGLTEEGLKFCELLRGTSVDAVQVPASCVELAERLNMGGYLINSSATSPGAAKPNKRAYLHVTQRCNFNCRFCYSRTNARNVLPDPSIADLKRSLGLIKTWGVTRLLISGGEPFLRDDLADILSYAKAVGISEITILSNGTLITPEDLIVSEMLV